MKKTQTEQTTPLPTHTDFASRLEEHPIVQWFADNGKTAGYFLLGALLLILLAYKFLGGPSQSNEMAFIQAENAFMTFQNSAATHESQQESFDKLAALMAAHPEIKPKYEGLVAQTLLNRGQINEAQAFGEQAIARTKQENDPYYTQYSETTLVMASKNFDEALKQATALNEQLKKNAQPGTILFPLNLLRIAMLHQQLGQHKEELQTWKEFKEYAGWSSERTPKETDALGFQLLNSLFAEGKISLLSYIETREKALKNLR